MGWKSFIIVIGSDKDVDEEKLLGDLGYNNILIGEAEAFESAIYPKEDMLYIGKYNGNTIICSQALSSQFLVKSVTKNEKVLASYFPDAEICALVLHSSVNFWGYSVSKNDSKLRARSGSSDEGTTLDFGEPLEQEKNLLQKAQIDKHGNRTYTFDHDPKDVMTEDQVGEEFVFELASRYFNRRLDQSDDLLFETNLKGFWLSSAVESKISSPKKPRSWWARVRLIIIVIILIRLLRKYFFDN